jgi:hypothetical protein
MLHVMNVVNNVLLRCACGTSADSVQKSYYPALPCSVDHQELDLV